MSIVLDLTLTRLRVGFREPVRFGPDTITSQDIGIVQLSTDDGLIGLGEVAGPTLPTGIQAESERLRRALVGREVPGRDVVGGVLGGALDTAILDVQGQREGRSIADMLGGGTDSVAVNALLVMTGSPAADAAAADAARAAGFRTIKLKPPFDAARTSASLAAIRGGIGEEVGLRLDLNGQLTEHDAIVWLATLERFGLEYVEQPIPSSLGAAAMARVRRAVPMPLAVDESLIDVTVALTLLDARACDVLIVKPSRVGGPLAAGRIVHAATLAGVAVTISTMYESGVGLAAALQVAATVPGDRAHGLGTAALLASDLIEGGLPIRDGRIARPGQSGLGVTLDASAVAAATAEALAHAVAGYVEVA